MIINTAMPTAEIISGLFEVSLLKIEYKEPPALNSVGMAIANSFGKVAASDEDNETCVTTVSGRRIKDTAHMMQERIRSAIAIVRFFIWESPFWNDSIL